MTTYRIPAQNIPRLQSLIRHLNSRCRRLGLPEIGLVVRNETTTEKHFDQSGFDYLVAYHEVEVTGESPRIAGWTYVGTVDHDPDGNTLRSLPGHELPEIYRTAEAFCEHCGLDRNRKQTYILQGEMGAFRQVGSTCLVDFTGHPDAQRAAAAAEILLQATEGAKLAEEMDEGGFGARSDQIKLATWLAYCAQAIRQHGWVPRSKQDFGRPATATTAFLALVDKDNRQPPLPEDHELAAKATAWVVANLESKIKLNEYEWNLLQVASREYIPSRLGGIAASLLPFYSRGIEDAQLAAGTPSRHLGTVGDKISLPEVKLVSVREIGGAYGITYLTTWADPAGNIIVWFASNRPALPLGATTPLRGTVKGHDEFRSIKQTVVTRCKVG